MAVRCGFNPHPAHRLGATIVPKEFLIIFKVSILTQLTGWVLRDRQNGSALIGEFQSSPSSQAGCYAKVLYYYGYNVEVSILTQLTGWVLQGL